MSDLQKLQELAADAALRGVTIKNVEIDLNDGGQAFLRTTSDNVDIEISIPEALQINIEDIDFNTCQLHETAELDGGLRDWVNAYLAALVEESDRETLVGMRNAINNEHLTAVSAFRGLGLGNFLTINTKPEAINRALLAPSIVATRTGQVLLPILGLARNGTGHPMTISAGGSFRITGKQVSGELMVSAGRFDSLHALNVHARCLEFQSAFSLPLSLSLPDGGTFSVGRNLTEHVTSGNAVFPRIVVEGNDIKMSYCPIAFGQRPGAAILVFRSAMKHQNLPNNDAIWVNMRKYNMSRTFEAYTATDTIEDAALKEIMASSLACQIETMLKSI